MGEAAQFQAMAVKTGIADMTDLINLTFCCQQATVITDFSDLNRIGRDHLMNLNGGSMPTAELEHADTRMAALKLILHEEGTVTPYGVVYDNGMKLEQLYDGQHLPAYLYEPCELMVEMTARDAVPDTAAEYLYLPTTRAQIERAMLRAGANTFEDLSLRFVESELPDEVDVRLDMEHEGLTDLNEMCAAIKPLNPEQRIKLGAVVAFAKPEYASQIRQLAENLELFDFVPKVSSPEEYGRYMIQESGHFDFDENLEDYYDYTGYAESRMREELGQFGDRGYVSYHGTLGLDELMMDDPTQTHGFEMGGLR